MMSKKEYNIASPARLRLSLGHGTNLEDIPSADNLTTVQEAIILIIGNTPSKQHEFDIEVRIINEQRVLAGLQRHGLSEKLDHKEIRKILEKLENIGLVQIHPISLNHPGIYANNKYNLTDLGIKTYQAIQTRLENIAESKKAAPVKPSP